jgi:5-methylcytosine-specific restriction enzyme subunit McrC
MSEPIVVFEHRRATVSGLSPTDGDRFAVESEELRKRLKMRWLANGDLSIKATSYVGVVELDCATIQVRPKLAGNELDVLAMLDYVSGLKDLRRLQSMRAMPDEGHDLRDLVCLLLVEACEDLLRHGVRRDYVRREERLPVVRGRLLADRQVLRRYGQLDQLECRYDEFDSDILDNRLCARALQSAARTAVNTDIRARARRAASHFADVCDSHALDPRLIAERLTYHRGNENYRVAHQWALLLLRTEGLHDLYSRAGPVSRSFMFDMNRLFESFVAKLLCGAALDGEFRVEADDNLSEIISYENGRSYTHIRPDIRLFRNRGSSAWCRTIDAKYKLLTGRKISTDDLYQSFAYAHALSDSDSDDAPCACIVYGSHGDPAPQTILLRRPNGDVAARIVSIGLNVPATLDALGTADERTTLKKLLTTVSGEPEASAGAGPSGGDGELPI